MAPLRNLADTERNYLFGTQTLDRLTAKQNFTVTRRGHPANRHQGSALAGTVGTDQGDDLALIDGQ